MITTNWLGGVWILDYNRPNIHHLTTLYLLSYISLYIVSVMVTMISFSYSLVLDTVLESRLFAFVKLSLIHSLRFWYLLRSWWHAAPRDENIRTCHKLSQVGQRWYKHWWIGPSETIHEHYCSACFLVYCTQSARYSIIYSVHAWYNLNWLVGPFFIAIETSSSTIERSDNVDKLSRGR